MSNVLTPVPTIYGEWRAKFGELWKQQIEKLQARFQGAILEVQTPDPYPTDVPIIIVKKESVIELLRFLKEEPGFEYAFLADLTATDETPREPRFDVVYNLFSHTKLARVRVKTRVSENESVPTAIPVWEGADWAEREVFDMFGVRFAGHPDLRRILMDERWEGHPLRKDYPLKGYQFFATPEPINPKLLEAP